MVGKVYGKVSTEKKLLEVDKNEGSCICIKNELKCQLVHT
jgi:hypothetical protein